MKDLILNGEDVIDPHNVGLLVYRAETASRMTNAGGNTSATVH